MRTEARVHLGILFAIMLLTIAVMAIVTAPAHAAGRQMEPLDFTMENAPSTGPGWSWDAQNNTLTLDGFEMDLTWGLSEYEAGIVVPDGTTIILSAGEDNRIAVKGRDMMSGKIRDAIQSKGDLNIISGEGLSPGRLSIQASEGANGIHSYCGDIRVFQSSLQFEKGDEDVEGGDSFTTCYDDPEFQGDAPSITIEKSFIISDSNGAGLITPMDGGIEIKHSLLRMDSLKSVVDTGMKGLSVSHSDIVFNSQHTKEGEAVLTRGPVKIDTSLFTVNNNETDAAGVRMLEPSSSAFHNDHFTFEGTGSDIKINGGAGAIVVEDHATGDITPAIILSDLYVSAGGELKQVNGMVHETNTYFWSFTEGMLDLEDENLINASTQLLISMEDSSVIPGSPEEPDYPADLNDIRIWHRVDMKPGSSYDASKAKWNTTVFISKPGDYALSGKSESVRVVIQCGGVNLYLEDGLHLNCGAHAYMGTRTAAIGISPPGNEIGMTVKLISKKDAKIYFAGYMAPAIRKDETKSELVFETEDPDHPGEIEAQGGELCAGIGGIDYATIKNASTGNITFNSGNIIAIGGLEAAGIGGGSFGGVDGITINGGDIKAYGKGSGASIGGGSHGAASNILINGGTVYAERTNEWKCDSSAAVIGSGGAPLTACNVKNIIISGGNVTAVGIGGVMIGAGGFTSIADNIEIKGGTVYAECKDNPSAESFIPAIGSGDCGKETTVNIEGGDVTAIGGKGAAGIGAYGNSPDQELEVNISGGTVYASAGRHVDGGVDYDIGMDDKVKDENVKVIISGGSVYAGSIRNAQSKANIPLHRVEVDFEEFTKDGAPVTDPVFSDSAFKYGANDVHTQHHGKVYFWLPNDEYFSLQMASVNGKKYTGDIKFTSTSGTLQPADGDEGELFESLPAKMTAKGKKSLSISWNKLNGAAGYDIFLAKCGSSANKEACKLVKEVKGSSHTWKKNGLKAKTAYQAYVKAYTLNTDGEKIYVASSPLIIACTSGETKRYTNPKSVTVKKSAVKISAGKTVGIKAGVKKLKKGKKLIPKKYAPKLRYLSTNTNVAQVSKSGKITAVAKGNCYIHVYAANGVSKKVRVDVLPDAQ